MSGVQETVLLVNHAFARGTPAIFVIFVVSRGLSSKTFVLLVRMQVRHFRCFRQKPPFLGGTKARFTKSTVSWTPKCRVLGSVARGSTGTCGPVHSGNRAGTRSENLSISRRQLNSEKNKGGVENSGEGKTLRRPQDRRYLGGSASLFGITWKVSVAILQSNCSL